MSYVDGFLLAVPSGKREEYRALAEKSWSLFKEWGAIRHVECWSDDVPHGKTTDFFRAVKAEDNESVVFSWIEYPSKEIRDAANKKMREDLRIRLTVGHHTLGAGIGLTDEVMIRAVPIARHDDPAHSRRVRGA